MGAETVGLISLFVAAAGASAGGYQASQSLGESKRARRTQELLEAERKSELRQQAAAREAAARRAETTGQRAGLRSSFMAETGFGTGNTGAGLGSGSLFGNA